MSDVFEIRGCFKLFANIQHDSYTNTGTFFLPEPIIGASINVVSFFRMLNIKFSSLRLVDLFLSMSPNEQLPKISDYVYDNYVWLTLDCRGGSLVDPLSHSVEGAASSTVAGHGTSSGPSTQNSSSAGTNSNCFVCNLPILSHQVWNETQNYVLPVGQSVKFNSH